MPFAFPTPTTVKLAHMNVRIEKHGDDNETALDLKFTRTAPNSDLSMLHPKLQAMLYWRSKATTDQRDIEGVEQILPDLRFPSLAMPLSWDLEITARVAIETGTGQIVLNPVKVNQLRIDAHQGGSVDYTFRVQSSNIPDGALDALGRMLDSDVTITLEPHTDKPSEAPKSKKGASTAPPKDGEASKAALDASGKNPFAQGTPETTPESALADAVKH